MRFSHTIALTVLLSFIVTGMTSASGQETNGRKYAILIGVRQYDKNQLQNLPFAENDVSEMAEVLKQSGFRRVELLTQAEGAKESRYLPLAKTVRDTIKGVLEDRGKDDLVLIAFAGHGVQFKGETENFFCPMDAVLTDRSTLISLTDVYDQLKQSKAGSKLLLVDACRNDPLSGNARAGADVELQSLTRPQIPDPPGGVAAFFSCSAGQRAFEDETLKHGVFFHHVILGLKGEARLPKRDEVTWESLVAYVKAEVPDTVKQLMGNSIRQIPENRGDLRGGVTLISSTIPQTPSATMPGTTSASGKPIIISSPFTADQAKAAQESWAKSLGKNVVEKNDLGMEFVLIPPGTFMMGSPPEEQIRPTRNPLIDPKLEVQVDVTLTSPFWLGKTEVTQGQWQTVMNTTPWKGRNYVKEGPDYPATFVSWDDAKEFIQKLRDRDTIKYRLPTEAEWEWSCRAGSSGRWSSGENDSDLENYAWFGNFINSARTGGKQETYAHEVGKKLANPFNLNDMHGNVWEWCEDIKLDQLPGGTNPKVITGDGGRVARGGSWSDATPVLRSAARASWPPDGRYNTVGFRISKNAEVKEIISADSTRTPTPTSGKSTSLPWPATATQVKSAQESLAESLGKKVVEKNSLGMEFVLIPPGKFLMGSPAGERDREQNEEQIEVTLTSPFWLGKTEVTQSQWQKVMGSTPWKVKKRSKEGPDYAAAFVSWHDAQKFVKKLSQRDGVKYRLPTEAEWEWSCRAGTSSRWSFGDNEADLIRHAWYGHIAEKKFAQEVGKKQANPFDLNDMHGNLSEWCEDVFVDKLPGGTNPHVTKGGKTAVTRGGAFFNEPRYTRTAIRVGNSPDSQLENIGFRVLRTQ